VDVEAGCAKANKYELKAKIPFYEQSFHAPFNGRLRRKLSFILKLSGASVNP